MTTQTAILIELNTRFGFFDQQIQAKGNWIVVYSEAEKKHVRLLVRTLPTTSSEKAFVQSNTALIRKAHCLGADYAMGVVGTWKRGFRSAFRTAGLRDGGPAWKLPGADGTFLSLKP